MAAFGAGLLLGLPSWLVPDRLEPVVGGALIVLAGSAALRRR